MLKANLPQHLNCHLRAKMSTTGTEPSLLFQLFLLRGKTRALQRQVEHWQQWPQRESFPVAVPEQHQNRSFICSSCRCNSGVLGTSLDPKTATFRWVGDFARNSFKASQVFTIWTA